MELYSRDGVWYVHGWAWDPAANRRTRVRKSTGIKDDGTPRNQRLAEQSAAAILQSVAVGQVRRRKSTTLHKAIALSVQAYERRGKAQDTIELALFKAKPLLAFFGADFDIARFTDEPQLLLQYVDARLKAPGRRRGTTLSRGTVHRELRTARDAQRDAKKANQYDGELLTIPDLGRVYVPRERTLDEDEFRRLVMALHPANKRDHLIVYRQLGLDEGELYRMERDDVDWGENYVEIRGTKNAARRRIMALPQETRAILERRAMALADGEVLLFERWENNNRDINRAAERIGSAPCCLKDMRRSFATELAEANVESLILQSLMGHTSGRMLSEVYARVRRGRHMQEAMAKVSRVHRAPDRCDTYGTENPVSKSPVDENRAETPAKNPRKWPKNSTSGG